MQILAGTKWTGKGRQLRGVPCVTRTTWVIGREYPRGMRNWWEQSTPQSASRLESGTKGNRRVTCRIRGCGPRGVLGNGVAPAALDLQCRVHAARRVRELRLVCVVVPVDGTQRRTDPKFAHIARVCRLSAGYAYGGVPSSETPSMFFHPPRPEQVFQKGNPPLEPVRSEGRNRPLRGRLEA